MYLQYADPGSAFNLNYFGLGAGDGADRRHLALDRPGASARSCSAPRSSFWRSRSRPRSTCSCSASCWCCSWWPRRRGSSAWCAGPRATQERAHDRSQPCRSPCCASSRLTKSFGGFVALDNISVDIRKGERFGLIGPNGSGKTTLVNCISGALRPSRGTVSLGGEDVTPLPPNHARPARHRAQLPDSAAIPQHDRAREPDGRARFRCRARRAGDPPRTAATPRCRS